MPRSGLFYSYGMSASQIISGHKEPLVIGLLYHKHIESIFFSYELILGNYFIYAQMINGHRHRIAFVRAEDIDDFDIGEFIAEIHAEIYPYNETLNEVPFEKWTNEEWMLWAQMTK